MNIQTHMRLDFEKERREEGKSGVRRGKERKRRTG